MSFNNNFMSIYKNVSEFMLTGFQVILSFEFSLYRSVNYKKNDRRNTSTVKKIASAPDAYPDRAGPRNPVRAGYISGWSRKMFLFFYQVLPL